MSIRTGKTIALLLAWYRGFRRFIKRLFANGKSVAFYEFINPAKCGWTAFAGE